MERRIAYLVVASAAVFVVVGQVWAGKAELEAGHEIKLHAAAKQTISSDLSKVGDTVTLSVAAPVKVGGTILVDTGSTAKAVVTSVVKAAKPGRPGQIVLGLVELQSAGPMKPSNGGNIKISGTAERKGGSRKFVSFVFGFGLLIKGQSAEFSPADTIVAKTVETTILEN